PALADENGVRHGPHCAQSSDGVSRPSGNMELFFRADDQVEEMQGGLQFFRNGGRFNEPVLAITVAGEAPKIGSVVDIEGGPSSCVATKTERLDDGSFGPWVRQMGAGRDDASCRADESRIDIVLAQRHVGAVLAIEDQGK